WESNKGYGTKDHMSGIEKHGICPHHRRSFAPIRRYLANEA
ncbi:MAG: ribonuclease HII, partial [Pseudomonadota bacterium]